MIAFDPAEVTEVALADFRAEHVRIAREALAEQRAADPSWAQFQTFVDGRFARRLEEVKLFGRIEFASEGMADAIRALWDDLVRRAQQIRDDGTYLTALRLYSPETGPVTGPTALPADVTEVDVYPLVPYARRIENGWSKAAPRGVFGPAATKLKRTYGRSLRIRVSYTVPQDRDAAVVLRTNGRGTDRNGRSRGYRAAVPVPVIRLRQGSFFA